MVFIKTCGFKNTAKLVWQYPAMILTPIFTFWTMGPKKTASTNKSCCGCWSSNDMRIGVSFFYTFVNFFITVSGSLFCLLITYQKLLSNRYFSDFHIFLIFFIADPDPRAKNANPSGFGTLVLNIRNSSDPFSTMAKNDSTTFK